MPPDRPAEPRRVFRVYGVTGVDIFLGDVLDPEVRDSLRKAFGLQPWAVVRPALTPSAPPPDNTLRVVRPVAPAPGMTPTEYARLMEERARDRLGSAV